MSATDMIKITSSVAMTWDIPRKLIPTRRDLVVYAELHETSNGSPGGGRKFMSATDMIKITSSAAMTWDVPRKSIPTRRDLVVYAELYEHGFEKLVSCFL